MGLQSKRDDRLEESPGRSSTEERHASSSVSTHALYDSEADFVATLFDPEVDAQIRELCVQQRQMGDTLADPKMPEDELYLYQVISFNTMRDRRAVLEDIMQQHIMDQFANEGVPFHKPGDLGAYDKSLEKLLLSVHSQEAAEVVTTHVQSILGQEEPLTRILVSKYIVMKRYLGAVLFGYFIRWADTRFLLTKAAGLAPTVLTEDDARSMLEDLYNEVPADGVNPDEAAPISAPKARGRPMTLEEHIKGFTAKTLVRTSRMLSQEAVAVSHKHCNELFGDQQQLYKQFEKALCTPSPPRDEEEGMKRMQDAISQKKVDTLEMAVHHHKTLILQAIAVGCYLRDAESRIQIVADMPLLTPNPVTWPPGDDGSDDGGGGGDGGDGGVPCGPGGSGLTLNS